MRGVLIVDEGDPVSVSACSPHPSFRAVNINDPLYVGGMAGEGSLIATTVIVYLKKRMFIAQLI